MIIDRDRLTDTSARRTAAACIEAGIEAAHPRTVVRSAVSLDGRTLRIEDATYTLDDYEEVIVIGGGKAAATVAAALEEVMGDAIARGVVVTNDPVPTERIVVHEADHPIPSERGVAGARAVLELAADLDETTLVLAIITGGASALLPAPAGDVTLEDLQSVTAALLDSGADITEINAVRKHLSAIKGGRLAGAAAPATVITLAFSDVVGNDRSVIASGPTVPDGTTFTDAIGVLERYDIPTPRSVERHLSAGAAEAIPETPGPDDAVFDHARYHLLADCYTALVAAREVAATRGYTPLLLTSRIRGEAREVAQVIAATGEEIVATGTPVSPPAVVLSGGETTVNVRGDGTGGPNQEFALAAAIDIHPSLTVAAVDSDGQDGATDAAGALVDSRTVGSADAARDALARNDVYPYLAARDALLRTGRTGTNVNDIHALVVE